MADNSILTPGYQDPSTSPTEPSSPSQYLERDNFLSEYTSESEKSIVRENLNVPSKDSVYDKKAIDLEVGRRIQEAVQEYLNMDDPHGIIPLVSEMIENMVKTDGSTPFVAPQAGIDPVSDNHLTTKKFVSRLLKEHINAEDPHEILPEVKDMLERYVKTSDIYSKSQLYTKEEINKKVEQYIRRDGTTPFTKAQVGADPTIDSHLTTKRYVDELLHKHLIEVDPHGFITVLNQRLSPYVKKKDVFDKTQTYSRTQIDNIISQIVERTVQLSIQDYIDSINDKFEYIRKQRYVKQDGSIPFRSPQSGADAVNPQDLVTLHQVDEKIAQVNKVITEKECEWKTSGPVIGSAGLVEVGTEFANSVTLQEIMDAIFYGKGINITSPELGSIGSVVEVTVCVQGSLASFEHGELYQNGKLIHTFTKGDFEKQGCITVLSDIITEDTEFVFKAYYINTSFHEVSSWTKLSMPVFVGLLPKWKFGNTVTYDYLLELYKEDGVNNKFYDIGKKLAVLNHKYSFQDASLKHIFLAIPADYPNLYQLQTPSQQFGTEAFDIIDMIPLQIPGSDKDVIYKLYIYREASSQLNIPVIFNFETDHE